MNSGRVAACIIALLWVASNIATAAEADLDRLMTLLAQRRNGHVSFVEKKYIAVLDRPVQSSGELLYVAPDHLEKRTLEPKPETLVLDGGIVSAQRGRHHYVLDLRQYPQVLPFIESIRATLAGDRAALERVFKVSFSGDLHQWKLELVPLEAKLSATVEDIGIEGAEDVIQSVTIQEPDGDHSILTIGPELGR